MSEDTIISSRGQSRLQGSKAAGIAAAVVAVLLVVGGIGWAAWATFGGPRQEDLSEVQPSLAQRLGGSMRPRAPTESVRATKTGLVANAGDVHLDANHSSKDKPWRLNVSYNRGDLMTSQQTAALNARFRLPVDKPFAKSLKVTDEQLAQLSAIAIGVAMPLGDDERGKLSELCQAYVDAGDKAAAQAALIQQLQALGPAKLAATRQSVADRAAAVAKILTPEQLKAFAVK